MSKKACKGKRQRDTLCKEFLFFSNDNFAIIQIGNSNRINVLHTTIMQKECNTQENFSLPPFLPHTQIFHSTLCKHFNAARDLT